MTKVGFVGLGRMGGPMALNMARKGYELAVYDLNPDAMQPFTEFNTCRQASSAADAADGADMAISVLPGPPEIDSVVLAQGGMLDALADGGLFMDFSTVLPETTDALAKAAQERGKRFVDAPIGRLASHAQAGESLFMVGATDADFETVRPVLEAMGTTIHHCGPPGSGTRTKLVNNYLAITSCLMNAEAVTLSQGLGLDLDKTLEVIHGTSATNGQLKLNFAHKVFKGDTEPGFMIDLAHKDLSLIIASAAKGQIPMPVAAVARESLSMARARGFGSLDFSALADFWCDQANVAKARTKG